MTTHPPFELDRHDALIIAGPTASGKSGLAMHIARNHDGIIINADSQQIYKGLPVLSAQPTEQEMREIPHRLYSFLDQEEVCDAHRWRELAKAEIESTLKSGKLPIIVGGTGLYISALVDGLSPVPDISDTVRADINSFVDQHGKQALYAKLREKDPEMANKLDPENKRRVARALEVLEETGISLAEWQKRPKEGAPENVGFHMIFATPDRETLRRKCDARFEQMMEDGALEEIKRLNTKIESGILGDLSPVTKAIGFRPFRDWLNAKLTWEDAMDKAKAQTRQYAKRQVTWFRHQLPENLKSVLELNPETDRLPVIKRTDQ